MITTSYRLFFIGTAVLLLSFSGCEKGHNKSVTGDYFDRSSGELITATTHFDSLTAFKDKTGEGSYTFAGRYKNVEAFTVIKFPQPSAELLDSLEQEPTVKVTVGSTWRGGNAEFALYETVSTWSDSSRLDPDMFVSIGFPVTIFSDTTSSLTTLEFRLSNEVVRNMRSWSEPGSFKIIGTETCKTMLSISSQYSSYKPRIEYIFRTSVGEVDTSTTESLLTNYSFDTGFDSKPHESELTGIVADADVRGFMIKLPLPDSLPATAAINKCIATFTVSEAFVPPSTTFYIGFYQLTENAAAFADTSYDSSNYIETQITDGMTSFDIDLTSFISTWQVKNVVNYGILVKPLKTAETPSYTVFSPPDSVIINYSTLPEVE
jgi:hypothetical protein